MAKKKSPKKSVETLTHDDARRRNIPTAELQPVVDEQTRAPIRVAYERRNRDLDPQLVWRGKDEQDWSDLVVQAPPLYIQEKVHPKVLIDDLLRQSERQEQAAPGAQLDLFADFNGLPEEAKSAEFYQHEGNWQNRMILGDSLQVMASLAEREGLRGKVQCIYLDPPYGIKFNSNFQWSTTSRDVKDGKAEHITREPEQVKAFRDTWRDGIHSYLTYLRDRLTVCRDLLSESGSIFVQIGDENVHRVRALMDEVFGERNSISEIAFIKTSGLSSNYLANRFDYLIWYGKDIENTKFRQPYVPKTREDGTASTYTWLRDLSGDFRAMTAAEKCGMPTPSSYNIYKADNITSQGNPLVDFHFQGKRYTFRSKTPESGLRQLAKANRIHVAKNSLQYVRMLDDFAVLEVSELWADTGTGSFTDDKLYVVQTGTKTIQRCLLMATDPGDLVLDPTCGSGTTAYVAEQWGRRWITIDTSRVALALARARIMGARYPYYLLSDSPEGHAKEAEVTRTEPTTAPTREDVRQGFVYERVPHITLKSIANNAEIDVIWEKYRGELSAISGQLSEKTGGKQPFEEWEIPRQPGTPWPEKASKEHERFLKAKTDATRTKAVAKINKLLGRKYGLDDVPEHPADLWDDAETIALHAEWWKLRIARQQEIDASIAAKAEHEYLYDKPYEDKSKVRVAGPFTVESLSPHRVLTVGADDELIDPREAVQHQSPDAQDFAQVIIDNLKAAGVQQAHKEDKIDFTSLAVWPGYYICAEGRYMEGGGDSGTEKRAGIFIGPEFGTVSRQDLVMAARECADAGFDVLISCAFNYEAHASEFNKLGRIPVLKARMNADLHMAGELKETAKANLFVIFGEPDIEILEADDDQIQVKIDGVDVFHPNSGEVHSDTADGIACWFIDTDYNEESFFVRQAYFLGAGDPYKSLKTSLKAEINEDAWSTLHSDTSRPFDKPRTGRIAVKVINHLGDEVMKVYNL